jgi:dipeptidyl aminopeptidase/acylaminoacyl peptidase
MKDFAPEDLRLHQKITAIHGAPDRPVAAAAVRSVDRDNNQYLSCIWEFSAEGQPMRQLTRGPGLDQSPRWSPDGRQLAFLSNRQGSIQIYVIDIEGGEARQVSRFEQGASSFRWAPDGRSLLATSAVPVDPDQRGKKDREVKQRRSDEPEVCWRLPYKSDGVGYLLRREIRLFRVALATGESTPLTHGPMDVMGFEASPDGKHIAYSLTREGRYAHNTDLWVCDSDGREHRRLTRDLSIVLQPVWSPDSRWIATAGAQQEGDGESRLWLVEQGSGKLQPLGPEGLEVADGEALFWHEDSAGLDLVRAYRSRHQLVSLTVPGGELKTLVDGDRQFSAVGSAGDRYFYAVDTPVAPSEMFCCQLDGSQEQQVGQLNGWWAERTPLKLESREFSVPDGKGGSETIQGWLLMACDAKGPMPLLSDVHGGPAAYTLLDFDTNVFWQVLCSRGWAVLMMNPVGSSSFGDEFCKRLAGHWGEYDLPQHRAALEQLREEGLCDERVAIAGKSYGGYFTSWAIGHCPDYRAAIVMAPVGNIETHYGTSDGGYYADPLYLATAPQFDRQRARERSPLQFIEKATTPTLFLQGKDDERCPKCQSEELFVSLYRAGDTPAQLVLYPGEDHHFLGQGKPDCRVDAAGRIVDWVTRYIGQPTEPLPQGGDNRVEQEAEPAENAAG